MVRFFAPKYSQDYRAITLSCQMMPARAAAITAEILLQTLNFSMTFARDS